MSNLLNIKIGIFFFLIIQSVFWYGIDYQGKNLWKGTKSIKPNLEVVPEVPSEPMVRAFSFGDEELYFRYAAYTIQNAGDSFGRVTPLKNYDYSALYKWWMIMDGLNYISDFVPSLVSYYYGSTQNPKDQIPYVVDYLEQHADRIPDKKWWWYSQAIYHAKSKLHDMDRAEEIATKLNQMPKDVKMPMWARQMKAFILEDKGEYNQACQIILNILDTYEDIPENELAFMLYFIKERINSMMKSDDKDIDPRCRVLYDENKG